MPTQKGRRHYVLFGIEPSKIKHNSKILNPKGINPKSTSFSYLISLLRIELL